MRKPVLLIIAVIALYVLTSLIIEAVYGPSYGFLQGEDAWVPDGHGGWEQHGHPASSPPAQPSVVVPIYIRYIPILMPALFLLVVLATPLRTRLGGRPGHPEPE